MGKGKSGIEPTEERVEGRDSVDGVSGTDDVTPSESRMLFFGWYWKDGVGSCILEASNNEGTWLGRGGRCGGELPAGGRYGSPLDGAAGAARGPDRGHCGTGAGLEIGSAIWPSLS